jgi:hypothetical protein
MEAINQVVIWRHILETVYVEFDPVVNLPANASAQDAYNALNTTADNIYGIFTTTQIVYDEVYNSLQELSPTSNATTDQVVHAINFVLTELFKTIFEGYGWSAPPSGNTGTEQFLDMLYSYYAVFELAFGMCLLPLHCSQPSE